MLRLFRVERKESNLSFIHGTVNCFEMEEEEKEGQMNLEVYTPAAPMGCLGIFYIDAISADVQHLMKNFANPLGHRGTAAEDISIHGYFHHGGRCASAFVPKAAVRLDVRHCPAWFNSGQQRDSLIQSGMQCCIHFIGDRDVGSYIYKRHSLRIW